MAGPARGRAHTPDAHPTSHAHIGHHSLPAALALRDGGNRHPCGMDTPAPAGCPPVPMPAGAGSMPQCRGTRRQALPALRALVGGGRGVVCVLVPRVPPTPSGRPPVPLRPHRGPPARLRPGLTSYRAHNLRTVRMRSWGVRKREKGSHTGRRRGRVASAPGPRHAGGSHPKPPAELRRRHRQAGRGRWRRSNWVGFESCSGKHRRGGCFPDTFPKTPTFECRFAKVPVVPKEAGSNSNAKRHGRGEVKRLREIQRLGKFVPPSEGQKGKAVVRRFGGGPKENERHTRGTLRPSTWGWPVFLPCGEKGDWVPQIGRTIAGGIRMGGRVGYRVRGEAHSGQRGIGTDITGLRD